MTSGLSRVLWLVLGVGIGVTAWPGPSLAQDRARPAARVHGGRAAHGKRAKKTAHDQVAAETPAHGTHGKKKRGARGRARVVSSEQTEGAEATQAAASKPPAGKAPARVDTGASAAAEAAQAAASGVNAQIVKEGDTSVKVMEFTGLGIEGRLKSPQLVYFVQRVRAEFERPVLPHRSFLPELEASTTREPGR